METFIVRVMHGDDDTTLRGVLRRVTDGRETTFSDADELLALLRAPGPASGTEQSEEPS